MLTPRFKFSYFGGGADGSLTDDGMKFTSADRVTLDRLLAAVELHDHHYRDTAATAGLEAGTAALRTDDGVLAGGQTFYYRFAIVDANGAESIASAEVEVTTPSPLVMPGSPGLTSRELPGTLQAGIYYYALSAVRGQEQSVLGPPSMVTLIPGVESVDVIVPLYGEAEAFNVWRMASTETGYTLVGTLAAPGDVFVDDGSVQPDPCACDPARTPPQSNVGSNIYAVELALPASAVSLLAAARSWRMYRTSYPGVYTSQSLVHEVVEREDEWDQASALMTSWVDDGRELSVGRPMDDDLNMRLQPFTFDAAETPPDPAQFPLNYPLLMSGALYFRGVTEGSPSWRPLGGGGAALPLGIEGEVLTFLEGEWRSAPLPGPGAVEVSAIMTSPDGSRFVLSVDDTGALVTSSTAFPGPPAPVQNLSVS